MWQGIIYPVEELFKLFNLRRVSPSRRNYLIIGWVLGFLRSEMYSYSWAFVFEVRRKETNCETRYYTILETLSLFCYKIKSIRDVSGPFVGTFFLTRQLHTRIPVWPLRTVSAYMRTFGAYGFFAKFKLSLKLNAVEKEKWFYLLKREEIT